MEFRGNMLSITHSGRRVGHAVSRTIIGNRRRKPTHFRRHFAPQLHRSTASVSNTTAGLALPAIDMRNLSPPASTQLKVSVCTASTAATIVRSAANPANAHQRLDIR